MSVGYAEETTYYKSEGQVSKKKAKSSFIAKWLLKKLKDENEMNQANLVSAKGLQISGGPSIDQPDRAIQFTIYTANGGRVVETRRYDRQKDRNTNGLYVITSDQDFGKEIDKIITMEFLK